MLDLGGCNLSLGVALPKLSPKIIFRSGGAPELTARPGYACVLLAQVRCHLCIERLLITYLLIFIGNNR